MQPKIVVVGSLNMDLIVRSPHIPIPGETVLGNAFGTAAGGKGANQAVAASRLGAQVTMVGCVGTDNYGQVLVDGLQADRVDTRFIRRDPINSTGVALITVDDEGENSIVVVSGANWYLTPVDVELATEELAMADVLLLQLETPLDVIEQAARIANDHHVPVILNPAPARALPSELLGRVTYLVPNEGEASLLSGLPVTDLASAGKAAEHLRQQGVEVVILTRGNQGAYVSGVPKSFAVPAFPVKPVDTTAAGDAFVAGLAFGIASKQPIQEAVRIAAATGALATTKVGAQPSLPSADQVDQLLHNNSSRGLTDGYAKSQTLFHL